MASPAVTIILRGYKDRVAEVVLEPSMSLRGRMSALLGQLAGGPALAARGLIQLYRHSVAALIGFNCRHLPTCSTYADDAIGRFGLWAGGWMTLARLARCQPWGTSGLDFVPETTPHGARWYLPWRYGRWRGTNAAPLVQRSRGAGPPAR